jgi:hypothetical protein
MSWLRTLMLLALIAWIGGVAFLAFVEAPSAFSVLPSTHLAGLVVGRSLTALHWIGILAAGIFLASSLALNYLSNYRFRVLSASHVLIVVMLAFTLVSQFCITPRMREVRSQLEMVQTPGYGPYVPGSVPDLIALYSRQFHKWSERLEGAVLFLGLGVVILTARRFGTSS